MRRRSSSAPVILARGPGRSPADDTADHVDEVGAVGVLQARSRARRRPTPAESGVVGVRREQHDLCRGRNPPHRLHHFRPGNVGQPEVEQDDIGLRVLRQRDAVAARCGAYPSNEIHGVVSTSSRTPSSTIGWSSITRMLTFSCAIVASFTVVSVISLHRHLGPHGDTPVVVVLDGQPAAQPPEPVALAASPSPGFNPCTSRRPWPSSATTAVTASPSKNTVTSTDVACACFSTLSNASRTASANAFARELVHHRKFFERPRAAPACPCGPRTRGSRRAARSASAITSGDASYAAHRVAQHLARLDGLALDQLHLRLELGIRPARRR